MNEKELAANSQASEYVVHDLNLEPALPFPDDSFDIVTNAVSVDYLNKPLEVFQEIHRVLKPGGVAYMSFSNRCFPTKGACACAHARVRVRARAVRGWQTGCVVPCDAVRCGAGV
jgi:ubiquinone/menaquinone biosynthesis C-methylase UbiE